MRVVVVYYHFKTSQNYPSQVLSVQSTMQVQPWKLDNKKQKLVLLNSHETSYDYALML